MMSQFNRYCILSTTVLLLSVTAGAAPYDDFKFGTPERIDFNFEASYTNTEGNFEKSGNSFTKLNSGSSLVTYDFDIGARAELAPQFHLYGNGRFTSAESHNTAFGTAQTKTNSGFSAGTVGSDFVLVSGRILVIPDFSFSFPIKTIDRTNNTETALSEGVYEGTGRVVLRVERRSYRFGGYAGFTYRDGGRSALLPYGALFELTFGKWNFGLDARGYQSLTYDKDSDREATIDNYYFCPANGCSKRFAAFNPAKMTSNLWIRVNATPDFAFDGSVAMDWSGSNTSRDMTIRGGMIYRWDYSGLRRQSTPVTPNYESPTSFEETTQDGVDQRPFRQAPKSVVLPANAGAAPEETPKARPVRKHPGEKTINIQEELNKTEMQIEQNSNTKEQN